MHSEIYILKFLVVKCVNYYDKSTYSWSYSKDCKKIYPIIHFCFQLSVFIIIAFIDIVAFHLIIQWKKVLYKFKMHATLKIAM